MGTPFFSTEFPSTIADMMDALDRAVRALIDHGWVAPGNCCWARLCLEEALSNAVRHGNRLDPARKVLVTFSAQGSLCRIDIQDEGGGFAMDTPRPVTPTQLGGRGLCLMKHFMSSVDYDNHRHCLTMTMARNQSCPGTLHPEEDTPHESQ